MDGQARVINVAGLPASESKTDSGSTYTAALPVSRSRCGFILIAVFSLLLSLSGAALYVNLLNAMPEFIDEGGNSTVEVKTPPHPPLFIPCSHFVLIPIAIRIVSRTFPVPWFYFSSSIRKAGTRLVLLPRRPAPPPHAGAVS